MADLLNLLFYPLSNGIMTVLTGFSLLYWLFVMISGDGFDFSVDGDLGLEGELGDVSEVDSLDGTEMGFFEKAWDFINVGKVPVMVIVTLFKFVSWILTLASSIIFGLGKMGIWSVLILIPVFIIAYFLMHFLTKPFVKLYKNLGYKGDDPIDFLGRTGKMKSTIENSKIGSAEFYINGDVIRLNVISKDGSKIDYNDTILILNESEDRKIFYVKKEINLSNI
jgi:hypothetical protein